MSMNKEAQRTKKAPRINLPTSVEATHPTPDWGFGGQWTSHHYSS